MVVACVCQRPQTQLLTLTLHCSCLLQFPYHGGSWLDFSQNSLSCKWREPYSKQFKERKGIWIHRLWFLKLNSLGTWDKALKTKTIAWRGLQNLSSFCPTPREKSFTCLTDEVKISRLCLIGLKWVTWPPLNQLLLLGRHITVLII